MKHNHVAKHFWKVNKPKVELDKKKESRVESCRGVRGRFYTEETLDMFDDEEGQHHEED